MPLSHGVWILIGAWCRHPELQLGGLPGRQVFSDHPSGGLVPALPDPQPRPSLQHSTVQSHARRHPVVACHAPQWPSLHFVADAVSLQGEVVGASQCQAREGEHKRELIFAHQGTNFFFASHGEHFFAGQELTSSSERSVLVAPKELQPLCQDFHFLCFVQC